MDVGENIIINDILVDRAKIISLPLHIKLVLMKQVTKTLDKNGSRFACSEKNASVEYRKN